MKGVFVKMTRGYSNQEGQVINQTRTKYNSQREVNYGLRNVRNNGSAMVAGGYYGENETYLSSAAGYVGQKTLENKRRKARERANEPIVVRKKVKSTPFPISFIFYTLVITITLMYVIYNYSVINDISYEMTTLESKISQQLVEKEALSVALDKKNDLSYIEQVATNQLGMVKSTDIVKRYVSISENDKVVVSQDNVEKAYLSVTLDSFKDKVGKIFK